MMVRRLAIERAGGLFDERFFMFYEDTDLCVRLRKKGYGLYIVPTAKAVHNYCHTAAKIERMTETLRVFNQKHYPQNILPRLRTMVFRHTPIKDQDCKSWKTPPSFQVLERLRAKYLFEWSPSPLFIPSIGYFGTGEVFDFSKQVWDFLGSGTYYSRITDPSGFLPKNTMHVWKKSDEV